MKPAEIELGVQQAFRRIFRIDQVPEDASPLTLEDWDSLHHLNLMLELELILGISISTQEFAEMMSYQAIVEILAARA